MSPLAEVKTEFVSDKVENEIFRRIVDGEYRAGENLPTMEKLAEEFGVCRNTVSAVLRRLISRGYLHPEPGDGMKIIDVLHAADFRVLCRIIRAPKNPARGFEVHGHLLELFCHTFAEMAQCAAVARGTDHLYWLRWQLGLLETRTQEGANAAYVGFCHHQLWWVLAAASGNLGFTVFVNCSQDYLSGAEGIDLMSTGDWWELYRAIADKDPFSARRAIERALRRKLMHVLAEMARVEGRSWERDTCTPTPTPVMP